MQVEMTPIVRRLTELHQTYDALRAHACRIGSPLDRGERMDDLLQQLLTELAQTRNVLQDLY